MREIYKADGFTVVGSLDVEAAKSVAMAMFPELRPIAVLRRTTIHDFLVDEDGDYHSPGEIMNISAKNGTMGVETHSISDRIKINNIDHYSVVVIWAKNGN